MWWIVVLSSTGLICTGTWLLLREYLASRTPAAPVAAATVPQPMPLTAHAHPGSFAMPNDRPAGASVEPLRSPSSPSRLPAVETHWPRLRSEIDMAITAVNESLAPIFVTIAKPGEPTWSLHNRGFGDYRRVRVGGESVAWLRLELAADLTISAHLRAHEPRYDMLNRVSRVDRPLTASRIAPALAECLAALALAAPRLMPVLVQPSAAVPSEPRLAPVAAPPPPPQALAPQTLAQQTLAQQAATIAGDHGTVWPLWLHRSAPVATSPATPVTSRATTGWGRVRPSQSPATTLIDSAVTLVNSAFAEAGARLVPAGDAVHRDPVGPDSRALSIDVGGHSVGLMLIEPVSNRIEIAVGVTDLANFDAARRRSHDLAGLTVHPLAETIATCAWPAIAAAKGAA